MEPIDTNQQHADALYAAAVGPAGVTDAALRAGVLRRGGGGPPVEAPYEDLARQIGEAAYQVTDAQVQAVREATGSDRAAFEIVMSACVGAGLARWEAAARAIRDAGHATA